MITLIAYAICSRLKRNKINDLPNEVLALIFLAGLNNPDSARLPIVVSHVCQRWRYTAINTAGLWSRVVFVFRDDDVGSPEQVFGKAVTCLERSKQALLDVVVKAFAPGNELLVSRTMQWIAGIMKPEAHRWRSLEAYSYGNRGLQILFDLVEDAQVPRLETLIVQKRSYLKTWTFQAFGGNMPRLKRFTLQGVRVQLSFLMGLRGVRKIEIEGSSLREIDDEGQANDICCLLKHASSLEVLAVDGMPTTIPPFQWSPPAEQETRIVASNIIRLKVSTPSLLAAILARVEFPSVEFLPEVKPELLPVIRYYNSFPRIRTLAISNFGTNWDQPLSAIPPMLSGFFWLETLTIEAILAARRLDRGWIKQFGSTCPNLQHLTVDYALGMSENAIQTMVEARIQAGEPMKRLRGLTIIRRTGHFDTDRKTTKRWMKWLKSNVEKVTLKQSYNYDYGSGAKPTPVFDDFFTRMPPQQTWWGWLAATTRKLGSELMVAGTVFINGDAEETIDVLAVMF